MTSTPTAPSSARAARDPCRRSEADDADRRRWDGPTYYGRAAAQGRAVQQRGWSAATSSSPACPAPARCCSAVADTRRPESTADTVRRGRYLSLLAPMIGSVLLIWDLHTPQRFYNMLRIAKRTSPMSIGTWILMSFTGFAGVSAGCADACSACLPGALRWLTTAARMSARCPQRSPAPGSAPTRRRCCRRPARRSGPRRREPWRCGSAPPRSRRRASALALRRARAECAAARDRARRRWPPSSWHGCRRPHLRGAGVADARTAARAGSRRSARPGSAR